MVAVALLVVVLVDGSCLELTAVVVHAKMLWSTRFAIQCILGEMVTCTLQHPPRGKSTVRRELLCLDVVALLLFLSSPPYLLFSHHHP